MSHRLAHALPSALAEHAATKRRRLHRVDEVHHEQRLIEARLEVSGSPLRQSIVAKVKLHQLVHSFDGHLFCHRVLEASRQLRTVGVDPRQAIKVHRDCVCFPTTCT